MAKTKDLKVERKEVLLREIIQGLAMERTEVLSVEMNQVWNIPWKQSQKGLSLIVEMGCCGLVNVTIDQVDFDQANLTVLLLMSLVKMHQSKPHLSI